MSEETRNPYLKRCGARKSQSCPCQKSYWGLGQEGRDPLADVSPAPVWTPRKASR